MSVPSSSCSSSSSSSFLSPSTSVAPSSVSSSSSSWQDEVFRICNELVRHNPSTPYAEMLQQAEDIHFRQMTRQIELEAKRTSAAIAAIPTPATLSNSIDRHGSVHTLLTSIIYSFQSCASHSIICMSLIVDCLQIM